MSVFSFYLNQTDIKSKLLTFPVFMTLDNTYFFFSLSFYISFQPFIHPFRYSKWKSLAYVWIGPIINQNNLLFAHFWLRTTLSFLSTSISLQLFILSLFVLDECLTYIWIRPILNQNNSLFAHLWLRTALSILSTSISLVPILHPDAAWRGRVIASPQVS